MKKRIVRKKLGRAKRTENALLKAMRRHHDVRGNLFLVPEVKRAMKKHDESLLITDREVRKRGSKQNKRRAKNAR
jgi:hypothetical protein